MGCTSTSYASEASEVSEDDRILIDALGEKDITELVAQRHLMSIGSTPDNGRTSFGQKQVNECGEEMDPADECLGFTCRKGLTLERPNQDSWCVLKVRNSFSMYAVFDGHGRKGHEVSDFVKESLPKLVIDDPRFRTDKMPSMLVDSFQKVQSLVCAADCMNKLSARMSGTTATLVIHDVSKKRLTVSHVGDSSAVLGRFEKGGSRDVEFMKEVQLTRDHKPNLKDEKARIERNGGRVVFDGYSSHYVCAKSKRRPSLNTSRCLGDIMGHEDCGITAEPEVRELYIQPEDHVLLLCSDSVWEFISPAEAVRLVAEFGPCEAMAAAEGLAKEAWDRWIAQDAGAAAEDVTVVVVFLNQDFNQDENAQQTTDGAHCP